MGRPSSSRSSEIVRQATFAEQLVFQRLPRVLFVTQEMITVVADSQTEFLACCTAPRWPSASGEQPLRFLAERLVTVGQAGGQHRETADDADDHQHHQQFQQGEAGVGDERVRDRLIAYVGLDEAQLNAKGSSKNNVSDSVPAMGLPLPEWRGDSHFRSTVTRTSSAALLETQDLLFQAPIADIRIRAFAALLTVGAQGEDVDLAMHAGIQILVIALPGIFGQAVDITALFPVARLRVTGGLLRQRLQALFGAGIGIVVELVKIERAFHGADILLALTMRASSGRSMTRGTTIAARMPRMITTTMISMSVKPRWRML